MLNNKLYTTNGPSNLVIKDFKFNKDLLNHPGLKLGITNIISLRVKINNYDYEGGTKGHRIHGVLKNLLTLKENLEKALNINHIDPIEYIIHLYYGEGLPVKDIFIRINHLGLNYKDETGFRKLLTDCLGWTLRARFDRTAITKAKNKANALVRQRGLRAKNEKLKRDIKQKVDNILCSNLTNIILENDFNIEEFNKLYNGQKIIYLMMKYYNLSLNDIQNMGVGSPTLFKIINKLLDEILLHNPGLEIKITQNIVQAILQNKYNFNI